MRIFFKATVIKVKIDIPVRADLQSALRQIFASYGYYTIILPFINEKMLFLYV